MLKEPELRTRLIDKLLLHGSVTRGQIRDGFGISGVAASKYAKWMVDSDVVQMKKVRLENVRRPVEVFALEGRSTTALALRLSGDRVACELVGADAGAFSAATFPVSSQTQAAVIQAVTDAVSWAVRRCKTKRRAEIDVVGLGVSGHIEPDSGMIFSVESVPDWDPCHLGDVSPTMRGLSVLPMTAAACCLHGLTRQIGLDDALGYIAFNGRSLAVASMHAGTIHMGRFGTGSGAVHRKVSDDPTRCFCGKRGCLRTHLRRGDASPEHVLSALPEIVKAMRVHTLGVKWSGDPGVLEQCCHDSGVERLELISDRDTLEQTGLRLACAKNVLARMLQDRREPKRRSKPHPEAFGRPLSVESDV